MSPFYRTLLVVIGITVGIVISQISPLIMPSRAQEVSIPSATFPNRMCSTTGSQFFACIGDFTGPGPSVMLGLLNGYTSNKNINGAVIIDGAGNVTHVVF